MKRKLVSVLLVAAMGVSVLTGCGGSNSGKTDEDKKTAVSDENVLEFYHGYYQDKSEWAAAQVMRDIYDEFAKAHSDGTVTFKPIPVENRDDIVSAKVAGGSFPDMVDVGGAGVPQSAISQNLVYDLKPYIDENKLQDAVGLNYTQHDMDGHIYAVPWQSPWVNSFYANKKVFEENGVKIPTNYPEFLSAVKAFNEKGVLPYALFGKEKQWCLHLYDIMATRKAHDGIAALDDNTARASDDAYLDAAKKLIELVNAGMLSKDVFNTTYDQAEALFTSGKAAMFMTGTWALKGLEEQMGDNIEVIYYPLADAGSEEKVKWNMSGGYSQGGFSVPDYSKNKEIAAKYAVLLSRKLNDAFVQLEGGSSIYKDSPKAEVTLGPVMQQYINDTANFKTMSKFDWNLTNQELKTVMEDKSQELLTGSISAEDFAKEIDSVLEGTSN